MAARWATTVERGAVVGVRLLAGIYRVLGRRICLTVMAPVVLYFYVTGTDQRRASLDFLRRAGDLGAKIKVSHWNGLRHQMSFAAGALDRLSAWVGDMSSNDVDGLNDPVFFTERTHPRGALVLSAHMGVPEVMRAIATLNNRRMINVVVHSGNAAKFGQMMADMAPDSMVRMVEVGEMGVGAAIRLSSALEAGEWVVLLADRGPPSGDERRTISVPFMGQDAPFPQGPFLLAAALRCPVHLLFCVREKRRYRVHFQRFRERIDFPRKDREGAMRACVADYAQALEERAVATPFQWFNFYDFWRT